VVRVILLAKQMAVLALLGFAGYTSAQFVITRTWGGWLMALVVLSATLPWLSTPVCYIPWIRSLRMPCWLVSLLPTIVMYLVVVYQYSITSVSYVFLLRSARRMSEGDQREPGESRGASWRTGHSSRGVE
jgi:hypothetical protein